MICRLTLYISISFLSVELTIIYELIHDNQYFVGVIILIMEKETEVIKKWLGIGSINVFGRPFAGKDTQCNLLADLLGGVVVGGGEILRSYHDQEQIKQLMSSGKLIPTELFLAIVLPYLSRGEIKQKALILDSIGRLKGEEAVIIKATTESLHPIKAAVLIELTEEQIKNRFDDSIKLHDRGERTDDRKSVLLTRLSEFKTKTQPVLDVYESMGLLIKIDGNQSRDEVKNQIITGLYNKARNS